MIAVKMGRKYACQDGLNQNRTVLTSQKIIVTQHALRKAFATMGDVLTTRAAANHSLQVSCVLRSPLHVPATPVRMEERARYNANI